MKHMRMQNTLTGVLALIGYETGSEGWKMDGDTPVFKDGNPVWVNADGTESTIQRDTVSTLRNESKTWRERAEKNLNDLKAFEGIDPVKAREALDKLKDVDLSKMINADKLEEVKTQVKTEYDKQLAEKDKALLAAQQRIDGMVLDSAFAGSEFIQENIGIPVELFRSFFGQFFKVEEGKIAAYDRAGNRIMSKKNIGEFADFDESVEMLVDGYSQKDSILKAPGGSGSGSKGNGGQGGGSARRMKSDEFINLPPAKQAELSALIREGKLQLVD